MNWWMVTGGTMALICAVGHAIAGRSMFFRPIKSDVRSELHAAVSTGMWQIITINFTLSAIALVALSHGNIVASLIAVQFAGYAAVYLVLSLRLGGPLEALSVDTFWCDRDTQRSRRDHEALAL